MWSNPVCFPLILHLITSCTRPIEHMNIYHITYLALGLKVQIVQLFSFSRMVVVKVCATNSLIYKLKEGVGICFYFYMISMVFVMNFAKAYNLVMYKNILNCRQTYGCWEWISMMSTYQLNTIVNISKGSACQLLFCTVSFHLFIVPIHYVCLYFWYLPIWCLDGGTFMSRRTDHRT